jgi:hypothetical protein
MGILVVGIPTSATLSQWASLCVYWKCLINADMACGVR